MIGCLGGLGRALSRWMMDRGARRFIFIGRSGTDRPSAQLLVDDLKKAACEVQVIRGDVSSESAVEAAFEAATAPVGGVVHAAMNLDVSDTNGCVSTDAYFATKGILIFADDASAMAVRASSKDSGSY